MTPEVLEDNLMPKVGDAACSLENGNFNRKHGKALFSMQLGSRKPPDGEILFTILLKGTQVEFKDPNECHTFLKSS